MENVEFEELTKMDGEDGQPMLGIEIINLANVKKNEYIDVGHSQKG